MRTLSHLLPLVLAAAMALLAQPDAFAQAPPGLCYPYPVETQVRVDTSDGRTIRGRLACLTDSQVVVRSKDGGHIEQALTVVRRVSITNRADSITDGVLKGAALGVIAGIGGAEGCHTDRDGCVFE